MTRTPFHEVATLHRAWQLADEIMAKALDAAGGGLTPRQAMVLHAISLSTDPSQTHLVERTGIDRSTLADVARRLQERGYVSRRRTKDDARRYAVALTVAGERALARAMKADLACAAKIRDSVSEVISGAREAAE